MDGVAVFALGAAIWNVENCSMFCSDSAITSGVKYGLLASVAFFSMSLGICTKFHDYVFVFTFSVHKSVFHYIIVYLFSLFVFMVLKFHLKRKTIILDRGFSNEFLRTRSRLNLWIKIPFSTAPVMG